jgi:DNA-binding NtrC family response regulator
MTDIIIIERDPSLRKTLKDALSEEGYKVSTYKKTEDSLKKLRENFPRLFILSTDNSGEDPRDALDIISEYIKNESIVLIFDKNIKDRVLDEVRVGVYDYLKKPVDISELKRIVDKYFDNVKRDGEEDVYTDKGFLNIVGKSRKMLDIYEDIERVAPTRASVLITGESGVGKELIADAIHLLSDRRDEPLVKVHCAALAEGVLESELFGHEKGAFTDAIKMHKGKFEQADGGTLFLDEISEIPPYTQVKLLRVLEDGVFERVGGSQSIRTDIRLISATNRDLNRAMNEGKFREDLFWRIRVIEINVPPLRERVDDIKLLVENFIEEFAGRHNKDITGITKKALEILKNNPWYGNVRELRNAVENMVVMSGSSVLDVEDIPDYIRMPGSKGTEIEIPVGTSIEDAEKVLVRRTLMEMGGDKERTANALGISTRRLLKMINKYKLG